MSPEANSTARKSPPRSWALPLHIAITGMSTAAMVLLSAVFLWNDWRGAEASIQAASRENARNIGLIINEKIRRTLEPARALLAQLALDPITQASTLDDRLRRLLGFVQVLDYRELISDVFVGTDRGEFLQVHDLNTPSQLNSFPTPAGARYLVHSVSLERKAPVSRWHFYSADLRKLGEIDRPEDILDPRTRPWYTNSRDSAGQHMTDPFVLNLYRQAGITLSQAARGGNAVVGINLALTQLNKEIAALRRTPNTHIAITDENAQVIADSDLGTPRIAGNDEVSLENISAFPVLDTLYTLRLKQPGGGNEIRYDYQDQPWYGLATALDLSSDRKLRLLVAIPADDLMVPLRQALAQQEMWALALALCLIVLVGLASRRIGLAVARMTQRAGQWIQDNAPDTRDRPSIVRELSAMDDALDGMADRMQNFLLTATLINREASLDKLLGGVLQRQVAAAQCIAGAVYLLDPKTGVMNLEAAYSVPHMAAEPFPETLHRDKLEALDQHPGLVALCLENRKGSPLGAMLLRHARDPQHESPKFRQYAGWLSSALAIAIETRSLIDGQRRLFQSIVQLLADAVDAKSPYIGGHCRRVPILADQLIGRLNAENEGSYAGFQMTEAERYEFRIGAWLHDCGKIGVPDSIADKATKLEATYNRIHEVRTRFEVLWRDAVIEHHERLRRGEDEPGSLDALARRQRRLQEDFAFVATCNLGGEFLSNDDVDRLHAIGAQPWMRHFNDCMGLAHNELALYADRPAVPLPARETLLADRPEHRVPWGTKKPSVERGDPDNRWGFDMALPVYAQDLGELHNLAVSRGTLTAEDRFQINRHVVQTYIMLHDLPWTEELARVPDLAATHHEWMNGQGYPRKLDAGKLGIPDQVMALADIFEALTAADRPYAAPKKMSQVLRIMTGMVNDGHLDAELFRYFLRSRLWKDFAHEYVHPEQIDEIDDAMVESLLKQTAPQPA